MSLWVFWLLAIYLLGYGAFFVTMFPINERLLAESQRPTNHPDRRYSQLPGGGWGSWRTYWPALFWTTGLSLLWPLFLYRHWRNHART